MAEYGLRECRVMLVRYKPAKTKSSLNSTKHSKKVQKNQQYKKSPSQLVVNKNVIKISSNCLSKTVKPASNGDHSRHETISTDSIQFFHAKAAERYEKLRVGQSNVAWESNLCKVAEKNDDQLGVWPPPKRKLKRALNLNRRPRKELPLTDLEPEVMVKLVQWDEVDKACSTEIPIVMIPEVEQNPPMIHWTETPINYRVEDGEFLANYPYLGEDMDADFENELYDLYDEKDYNSAHKPVMPDEVFWDTVNDYEKSLVTRQEDCKRGSNLQSQDLTRVKRYGVMMPSRIVFAAMANTFTYLGFPYELEERYARIYKVVNADKAEEADNLPDAPNLDESLTDAVDPDRALSTYQKLFCPRCLVYCCITHDADDLVDPKYQKAAMRKQETEPEIVCDNLDCIEKPGKDKVLKSKKGNDQRKSVKDNWTPHEITMCKLLFRSSKQKPCYISTIMTTKSCREIKEFLQSELGVSFPMPSKEEEGTVSAALEQGKETMKNSDPGEKYVARDDTVDSADFPHYRPCIHADNGGCNSKNMCCCVVSSTFCERWCSCPLDCPRRFKGCNCKTSCGTIACPCYRANRECDPTLCLKCGSENPVQVEGKCQNVAILHRREKPIELKKSVVAGWGGYIGCDVKKWELVAEYRGEVISQTESSRRGFYYDRIRHTYLFSLNEDLVVDATRIGSKVRFVNSSKNPNCFAKVMMVHGDHRIGIYAKRNISAGEELFFDYENIIKECNDKRKGRKKPQSKSSKTGVVKRRR